MSHHGNSGGGNSGASSGGTTIWCCWFSNSGGGSSGGSSNRPAAYVPQGAPPYAQMRDEPVQPHAPVSTSVAQARVPAYNPEAAAYAAVPSVTVASSAAVSSSGGCAQVEGCVDHVSALRR